MQKLRIQNWCRKMYNSLSTDAQNFNSKNIEQLEKNAFLQCSCEKMQEYNCISAKHKINFCSVYKSTQFQLQTWQHLEKKKVMQKLKMPEIGIHIIILYIYIHIVKCLHLPKLC